MLSSALAPPAPLRSCSRALLLRSFSLTCFGAVLARLHDGLFRRDGSEGTSSLSCDLRPREELHDPSGDRGVGEVGHPLSQVHTGPSVRETSAKPHPDEVVVFHDFFPTGLRFPLDPAVVEVFMLFGVFLH